jgi:hypothetical protein
MQKERPLLWRFLLCESSVNMTTIMSGNFFKTNCDGVNYSAAHILSYLVAGLND